MIGFLKFVLGFVGVVILSAFVFMGCAAKAASDYGNSHDMSTEVNLEDLRELSLPDTWNELCSGEHHPSWDVLCDRKLELPSLDSLSPEQVFEKYQEIAAR